MGYYIQTPGCNVGKADIICKEYNAKKILRPESWNEIFENEGLICVVSNGLFEAAAFCYNEDEFKAFNDPTDTRPKTWLVMDRKQAEKISDYS